MGNWVSCPRNQKAARNFARICLAMFLIGNILDSVAVSASRHPDIAAIPLSEFEPRHDLPASEWRAPYCLSWQDNCTVCSKRSVNASIDCNDKADAASECDFKFSACVRTDPNILSSYCKMFAGHGILYEKITAPDANIEEYIKVSTTLMVADFWKRDRTGWRHMTDRQIATPKGLTVEEINRTTGVVTCVLTYSTEEIK